MVAMEDLREMSFELKLEGNEGETANIWAKSIPGRDSSECKDPVMRES